ncbi:hypothetical protein MLD38_018013 [Melastoma candidum]|uniref:Uncharacterized protein n=1 Tax=Melastoma candidum TaxID=119954 RepID=A0ACB9QWK3_9MYRT|nr:hypothetical protein MLD38_018013 [Melastoma candidum]
MATLKSSSICYPLLLLLIHLMSFPPPFLAQPTSTFPSPSPVLSPDIAPLQPSEGRGIGSAPSSGDPSSIPTIPSSPSPPNPDDNAGPEEPWVAASPLPASQASSGSRMSCTGLFLVSVMCCVYCIFSSLLVPYNIF